MCFYKVVWNALRNSSHLFCRTDLLLCVFLNFILFPLQIYSMGGNGASFDVMVSKCSHPGANWKQPSAGRCVSFLFFQADHRAPRASWRNSTIKQSQKTSKWPETDMIHTEIALFTLSLFCVRFLHNTVVVFFYLNICQVYITDRKNK